MINSGHALLFATSQAMPLPLLPDGRTPLKTYYTGFRPLDSYFANLQFSIIPTVDGSSPALSILGWHWMGLLLAVFTVMLVEGLRSCRARDLVFFVMWGLAIQYAGYFLIMPLYCYMHLLSRSASSYANLVPTRAAIQAVPVSVLIGLVLPSVAMCLPNRCHIGQSRQVAVAIWQNFPAWMALVHTITMACSGSESRLQKNQPTMRAAELNNNRLAVRQVYKAVATVSAFIHISGLIPIVLTTIGWPGTWPRLQDSLLLPRTFFLPPGWANVTQISVMADGAFNFLRYDYYLGTAAALVWVAILEGPSWFQGSTKSTCELVLWDIICTFLMGPGFTIVSLMDRRESRVDST